MDNKDPLMIAKIINKRSGRPKACKVKKFCDQPKSIVSLTILEAKNNSVRDNYMNNRNIFRAINIKDVPNNSDKQYNINEEVQLNECKDSFYYNFNIETSDTNLDTRQEDDSFSNISEEFHNKFGETKEPFIQNEVLDIATQRGEVCKLSTYKSTDPKQLCKNSLSHTKEPVFSCDFVGCEYRCKILSNLIKHKRIHTAERPYLCDKCSFRSNFISSLKVHARLHTNDKPYCCERCGYRCNSASNFKKHWFHHHADQPYLFIKPIKR